MTNTVLKVSNLGKDISKKSILHDINLSLKSQDIYALMGANGVGKTTLLSVLSGLVSLEKGTICINENKFDSKEISLSFQTESLYSYLNSKDNIDLLTLRPQIALDILKRLNPLEDIFSKKVKYLSYGQKQRLSLAITLSKNSLVYLLDEPTNGLDKNSADNLMTLIKEMSKNGCSFIIVSHEWEIIEKCCNRMGIISNGIIKKELSLEKDSIPIIRLKTFSTIEYDVFQDLLSENMKYQKLADDTVELLFDSNESLQNFHRELISKNILIEEWRSIKSVENWRKVYTKLLEEDKNAKYIPSRK